jgi:hypothetical protein
MRRLIGETLMAGGRIETVRVRGQLMRDPLPAAKDAEKLAVGA